MATPFTSPAQVQAGVMATGAITAVVTHNLMLGLVDGIRAARVARQEAHAFAAWDAALGDARRDAAQMGNLAKAAVEAVLDAQDEAEALRAEVARLRRSVDQREAVIRALAA